MKKSFIIYLLFTYYCYSQAGSFDTSFDGDGKNTYCFAFGVTNNILDAGFQASGKIISFSVDYTNPIFLSRWNTNGSLDTSFGTSGIQIHSNISPFVNGGYYPYKMVIQPDDKIIIMGLQQGTTYPNAYWIVRLLPNGALDTTFNGTGYKDLSFGTIQDRGTCVSLQADGKILLGGTSGNTAEFFTVARLNSNGTLDTGFGNGGKAQIPFNGNESFVQSMAVQTDGKIVLGGYTVLGAKDFALARVNSNGTLDTSFGTNGKVITTLNTSYSDLITDLVIEPNGNIIAGGCTSSENSPRLCLVRYLPNGSLDTSFNSTGILINQLNYSRNCTIARQIDGKYVVGGGFDAAVFEIYRYNSNGSIDTSFGVNGFVEPFQGEYAIKVLIQSDNKIVVCGGTYSSTNQGCAAVVRLNAGTLGVGEFERGTVVVYPNPSTGIVSFDNSESQYEKVGVYNCLGQEVMKPFDCAQGDNMMIDLSGLSSGVYMLRFEGNEKSGVAKVVKE